MLAKLMLVAAHRGPADSGSQHDIEEIRGSGVVPCRALVNPGAQQSNLIGVERVALSLGGHFQIRHQSGDVMDERAFAAVTGEDVHAIFAAFEGCVAVIEAESSFGFFRSVASNTGSLKNRFDVAG